MRIASTPISSMTRAVATLFRVFLGLGSEQMSQAGARCPESVDGFRLSRSFTA